MFPNKPNTTGTGGVFQTQFYRNLVQNLPYKTGVVEDTIKMLNPKYDEFKQAFMAREEALRKNSVTQNLGLQGSEMDATAAVFVSKANTFLNMGIDEQKMNRIKDWQTMASYSDMQDALDEIINEMFNPDDLGRVQELQILGTRMQGKGFELEERDKEELQGEFDRYMSYFDFNNNGELYGRQFLVTGELFFEQIIHQDYMEEGVLGVIPIPQALIEPVYMNYYTEDLESFIVKKPLFDPEQPNQISGFEIIPMQKNQIIYIHSGSWNAEKTCRLPHIEQARRAWRQLSLIEDSIIIYRLVRAPERLIFNIDVGNMAKPQADAYLNQLSREYWSKKAIDPNSGDITQKYNPQSMLDAFWFPKRTGSEGSSVTQLAGGQNLGELADLMYFAQKLFKSLRVPTSRLQSDNTYRDGTDILREELKFALFIMGIQKKIARAIKQGFLTHLEFTGFKKKTGLMESDIEIRFNPPTNFHDMRESKGLELRMSNFNNITANPFISKTYAMVRYLNMKSDEIRANRDLLRADAELEWELNQIKTNGPKWAEIAAAQQNQLAAGGGQGAPGGMEGGPGGGLDLGGGGPSPFSGGGESPFGGETGGTEGAFNAAEAPIGAETGSESMGMGQEETKTPELT